MVGTRKFVLLLAIAVAVIPPIALGLGLPTPLASAAISDLALDASLPAPTNICGESGLSSVTLSWDRTNDQRVSGHVVQFQEVGAAGWTDGPIVSSPTSVAVPGTNGVRYRYRVASTSNVGTRSDWGSTCVLGWGQPVAANNSPNFLRVDRLEDQQITKVVTGALDTCAIAASGYLSCWGWNQMGQLGNGTTVDSSAPITVDGGALAGQKVVDVGGSSHTCAVTSSGALACWGWNLHGQLGIGSNTDSLLPVAVDGGTLTGRTVTDVAVGGTFTCALTDLSQVVCWGSNEAGQLGTGTNTASLLPAPHVAGVLDAATVVQVVAGGSHACALTSLGSVACWGSNVSGQLGDGSFDNSNVPVAITGGALTGHTVKALGTGSQYTCAILDDDSVACWGDGLLGQLGSASTGSNLPLAVAAGELGSQPVATISTGLSDTTCAVTAAGGLYCWGYNVFGQAGTGEVSQPVTTPTAVNATALSGATIAAVSGGAGHICAATTAGELACVGQNSSGQLGRGFGNDFSATYATVAVTIARPQHLSGVAANQGTTCGLRSDGQVTCDRLVAAGALVGKTVTKLTAGISHMCALSSDGAVACWGDNAHGQLGNNSPTNLGTSIPQAVTGALVGETVVALDAGGNQTCAVTATGAVACWGENAAISIVGAPVDALAPVVNDRGALASALLTTVSAGTTGACGLDASSNVYCWNVAGTTDPALVADGALSTHTVAQLAVGGEHVCAITSSSEVLCWGTNGYGQIGAGGVTPNRVPPTVVAGVIAGLSATSVVAGQSHSCALLENGTTACWGRNNLGQLGDGTTTNRESPKYVIGARSAGGGLEVAESGPNSTIGLWSGVASPGVIGYAPTGLDFVGRVGKNVTLKWNAPTWTGAGPITGYRLEVTTDIGETWTVLTDVANVTQATVAVPRDDYWMFRIRAITAAGVSEPFVLLNEMLVVTDVRAAKSNVTATFLTPAGDPVVGATVQWRTTDNVFQGVGAVVTNAAGAVTFAVLETGPVRFTLSGGSVGSQGVTVGTASITTVVQKTQAAFTLRTAPAPSTVTRTITVLMPDLSPVPDTALQISGGMSGQTSSGTTSNVRSVSTSWVYPGFGVSSSGPTGTVSVTGFDAGSVGSDVVATFSDGQIQQTASAALITPTVTVTFEQMPVVHVVTTPPPPLDPGAGVTVTVEAIDGTGSPILGADLTLGTTSAKIATPRRFAPERTPSVELASGCQQTLTGSTGPDGRITFVVCPTATSTWRADGTNIVASTPVRLAVKPAPTQVAGGGSHSCARVADGTARCWGLNSSGQLGNGTLANASTPVPVSGLSGVSLVAAGGAFSCAVVAAGPSGRVRCWGANNLGQLGNGTLVHSSTAVPVTTAGAIQLTGVSKLAAGRDYVCAVLSPGAAGTVRCWGSNASGQLGDGTLSGRTRPVAVKSTSTTTLKGVTAVATGVASTCALLASGAVKCWGLNSFGQLGNNSIITSRLPVSVAGIDGVAAKATAISVGDGFACARLATGGVRCWGRNDAGQLGNGGSATSRIPVAVKTSAAVALAGASAVTVGGAHACATVGSGATARVRCWGSNSYGQLGDGTIISRRFATLLTTASLTGVKQLALGAQHTIAVVPSAIRTPSSAATWGRNSAGQLGNASLTTRSTPAVLSKL